MAYLYDDRPHKSLVVVEAVESVDVKFAQSVGCYVEWDAPCLPEEVTWGVMGEIHAAGYGEAVYGCADGRKEALAAYCILHPSPHVLGGQGGS